ncbi:Holliday junction resolvase RecU [Alkalihalobacillus sp. NPDC078783]
MKRSYANRGQAFEMAINFVNQQYKNMGVALINKRPTPVKVFKTRGRDILKAQWEAKSTVDYDGVYKGKAIAFEAKSVGEKRFDLDLLKAHQLQYLIDAEKNGAISFVLIEFRNHHLIFYCPVSFIAHYVKAAETGGRKSIPIADFEVYAYEVERGRQVTLDYLAVIDHLQEKQAL